MVIRLISIQTFMALLAMAIFGVNALRFEDNGYKDLVVSISPDIEEGTDGQLIIDNIKVAIYPFSKEI